MQFVILIATNGFYNVDADRINQGNVQMNPQDFPCDLNNRTENTVKSMHLKE